MSLLICVADIAGVQPILGVNRMRCCVRFVEVTFHNLWTANTNLAFLICTQLDSGFRIHDFAFGIGRRRAN